MKERKDCADVRRELIQTREQLRETERLFRAVADNAHGGILIVDDNYRITYANNEGCRLLGLTRKKVIGRDFREFLVKECRDRVEDGYRRRQRGVRIPSQYQFRVAGQNGERIIEVKSTVHTSKGKAQTIAEIFDVTEHKTLKEDRRRFEQRLSALNTYSQSLIMAKSMEEIYTLTLDAMEKTLGFEHAAFLIAEKGKLRVAQQRGYPMPLLVELPLDGTMRGITVLAANARIPTLVPDVRLNKEYVKGIPSIRSELAVPVDSEGRILGVLNVESKKPAAFDIRDMHLLQILASHAATAMSNLEKRKEIEKRSNQLTSLMSSSTKIMSSTSLRQRLQTIAEAIRGLGWRRVVISVRDGNMEIAKPEDIVTAGLTEDEASFLWDNRPPGQVWRERFGPDFARFRVGEFYHLPWSDSWVRKKFTDSTVPSRLSQEDMVDWDPQDLLYAPLRLADGRIVGVLSVDDPADGRRPTEEALAPLELFIHQAAVAIENAQLIESLHVVREQLKADAEMLELKVEERTQELKKSQEQLLKAQRLAAIGELASMVGHDLRNPLTGIAGATYYLRTKLSKNTNERTREMVRLIEREIEYSNKIINDLLDYSREMQLELAGTTLKQLTKEALVMVDMPRNVKVKDLTRSKARISVDAGKMKRVFVNIIKNAVEAMPRGGVLTLRSRETDDSLNVDFSDTGVGMPRCVLARLWTPLFTTKAKGMGLGLSICKRITEAHGGRISVESIVGKGTTFTVTIPLSYEPPGGENTWIQPQESSLLTTTKA